MEKTLTTNKARPFLKWAGGKTQLLSEIESRLPTGLKTGEIDTYLEPFVGGGAVFFHVAQRYEFIKHFYLFDINQDLVNCYNIVKNEVEPLIDELRKLKREFLRKDPRAQKNFYLNIRNRFNIEKSKNFRICTAAKLIFLNKTCFNGLYRVNRKNEFNVPFGGYRKPSIFNENILRSVSEILQKAEIICGDFEESEKYINENTFVYLDPPYRPISPTASFTSYSRDNFTEHDQVSLSEFCIRINKMRAKFILSNSNPRNENPEDNFFEKHYRGFKIETVKATRAINCNADKRGAITEILVMNY